VSLETKPANPAGETKSPPIRRARRNFEIGMERESRRLGPRSVVMVTMSVQDHQIASIARPLRRDFC